MIKKSYIGKEIEIEFIKNPRIKILSAELISGKKIKITPKEMKNNKFCGTLKDVVINKNKCTLKMKIYVINQDRTSQSIILLMKLDTTLSNIKSITEIVYRMPRF